MTKTLKNTNSVHKCIAKVETPCATALQAKVHKGMTKSIADTWCMISIAQQRGPSGERVEVRQSSKGVPVGSLVRLPVSAWCCCVSPSNASRVL